MDVEYGSGKIKLLLIITVFCLLHSGSAFCLPSGLVGNGNTFGRQLRSSGNPFGHSFFDLLAVSTNEETDDGSGIESIEFPAPLTGPQQFARSAEFWKSAVPIIASYYKAAAELKFRQDVLGECISEEEECQVWNDLHETGARNLADTITSLKGFYVKTAQIISSREDLFPKQYTDALAGFTDDLDPMPGKLVKAVIVQELLNRDEVFEDVFTEFDDIPLGSASIGQVHRAILSEKYGGPKEVAVKVQRPAIESKLLGDIANLITITKPLKEADALPLDYYAVFCELEKQLADEFDFVAEASAMDRIYKALARSPDGSKARDLPLKIPRPVPGLISRRVLVMDYLKGVPLSRARDEMIKKGIDPDGPESKIFGRRLLKSLTEVFGRSILETGFFHADPHPGNIFVLEDGSIGLIDFGQVKQISGRSRETLAKVMIALNNRESDSNPSDLKTIGDLALELGVTFKPDIKDEAPAAVAMWLFDGTVENLPGGYDKGELSPNSPVKDLESFPQDLVLVGRSSILIKGLSNRLGIPWSLAAEWAPIAEKVLALSSKGGGDVQQGVRFLDVLRTLKTWTKGKVSLGASRLPPPIRKRVATLAVKIQERRERRQNRNSFHFKAATASLYSRHRYQPFILRKNQSIFPTIRGRLSNSKLNPVQMMPTSVTSLFLSSRNDEFKSKSSYFNHKSTFLLKKILRCLTLYAPLFTLLSAAIGLKFPYEIRTTVGALPVVTCSLSILMLAMGISTTPSEFSRALRSPFLLLLNALFCFVLMPLLSLAISKLLGCNPALTAGTVLLGSVSGGQASNLFALLAGGDVSLSVVCTLSTTILGVVATPLLVKLLLAHSIPIDLLGVLRSVSSLVLIPLLTGLSIGKLLDLPRFSSHSKSRGPSFAKVIKSLCPAFGILATLCLVAGGAANSASSLVIHETGTGTVAKMWKTAVASSILLPVSGGFLALCASFVLKLNEPSRRTLVIEVLSKSPTLSYVLALKHFGNSPVVAVVPAVAMVSLAVVGAGVASIWSLPLFNVEDREDRG